MRQAPKTEEGIKASKKLQFTENVVALLSSVLFMGALFLFLIAVLRDIMPGAWTWLTADQDVMYVAVLLVGSVAGLLSIVIRLHWRIRKLGMAIYLLIEHADEIDEELERNP